MQHHTLNLPKTVFEAGNTVEVLFLICCEVKRNGANLSKTVNV